MGFERSDLPFQSRRGYYMMALFVICLVAYMQFRAWPNYKHQQSSQRTVHRDHKQAPYLSPIPSGLVSLNSTGVHPIHGLVAEADKKYHSLVARQSKSLSEAAAEYRRRHGWNPPKGFDKWYEYAVENGVIFIDEFDFSFEQFEPYLALPASLIKERMLEDYANDPPGQTLATIEVDQHGKKYLLMQPEHPTDNRPIHQYGLFTNFTEYMEVGTTFIFHLMDSPAITMSAELKQELRDNARRKNLIPLNRLAQLEQRVENDGVWRTCPEGTPSNVATYNLDEHFVMPTSHVTLIQDSIATKDFCQFPEWRTIHNAFEFHPELSRARVGMAMCTTTQHSDINVAPIYGYERYSEPAPDWKDRTDKIFWRGSTTGPWEGSGEEEVGRTHQRWQDSQRFRLNTLTNDMNESHYRDVHFSDKEQGDSIYTERISLKELNEEYLDVGFTGDAPEKPERKKKVEEGYTFKGFVGGAEQRLFKYLLDADGNGWSSRFIKLLSSETVIFRSTGYTEPFQSYLIPWYHYVPIQIDYSDLYDISAFFLGEPNNYTPDKPRINNHDEIAEQIAKNALAFTQLHWRPEDMNVWSFRLMLEWNRMMMDDRSNMDYVE